MTTRFPERILRRGAIFALLFAPLFTGCDTTQTYVVLDNQYPPSAKPLVIYHAYWQAVSFQVPIPPGISSAPQSTVPASTNTAYVVLAPGWDPTSSTPPTSFIVMQTRVGFGVRLNDTVRIPVDDTSFVGNCTAASFLSQDQADFITQRVFPMDFSSFSYNAASCTTTPLNDAGGPG